MPQTMGEQYAISFGWLSESPFNVSNAYLCLIIKSLVFLKGLGFLKQCVLYGM